MQHLFLIAIGPVQDFIRQARRSRDLYYGSWLLSELSKSAANAIAQRESLKSLIFPAPGSINELSPGSKLTVANKVLAQIETEPNEMGRFVHTAVQQHIQSLWQQTKKKIYTRIAEDIADQQINDLLEFFWASVPRTQNYQQDRRLVETLLASRKNTRNFLPPTWSSDAFKSSLDGQRESVIPEESYAKRGDDQKTLDLKAKMLLTNYNAAPAERLSGVDLLKRKGQLSDGQEFPSTSHIAAIPFIVKLEKREQEGKDIKPLLTRYLSELHQLGASVENLSPSFQSSLGNFDGSIFYPARFIDSADEHKDAAQRAYRKFMQEISHQEELNPYYAILLADGDGMGRVIDAQTEINKHQSLSFDLSQFADSVPKIIQRHRGGLIYAGGDDVMAFVPLNRILHCGRELAHAFCKNMETYKDKDVRSPTLSMGIAVGHFLEPMDEILDLARQAEQRAKRVDGKDALAITVSKRSGSDRTVAGKWGQIDARLLDFVDLFQKAALPSGVAYELLRLGNDLGDTKNENKLPDIVVKEALRIIKRKRSEDGARELEAQVVTKLELRLHECESIQELSNELIVAQMIAGVMAESEEMINQPTGSTSDNNEKGRRK